MIRAAVMAAIHFDFRLALQIMSEMHNQDDSQASTAFAEEETNLKLFINFLSCLKDIELKQASDQSSLQNTRLSSGI